MSILHNHKDLTKVISRDRAVQYVIPYTYTSHCRAFKRKNMDFDEMELLEQGRLTP